MAQTDPGVFAGFKEDHINMLTVFSTQCNHATVFGVQRTSFCKKKNWGLKGAQKRGFLLQG